jgi:hypothetical protein
VTNQPNCQTFVAQEQEEEDSVSKKLQLSDQQTMLLPHDLYKEQTNELKHKEHKRAKPVVVTEEKSKQAQIKPTPNV